MNTDHCFRIGSTHAVCQDYAISGIIRLKTVPGATEDIGYAIVSDGCSGAAFTDIGSRCLTHAARHMLMVAPSAVFNLDAETIGRVIIDKAASAVDRLGLTRGCLQATLLMAVVRGSKARVLMFGDGGIVRQTHGCREVQCVSYDASKPGVQANAPYYLAHRLSVQDTTDYFSEFSQFRRTTIIDSSGSRTQDEDAGAVTDLKFDVVEGDQIVLLSDGIDQFYDGKFENIHWSIEADALTKFKSTHGEFVTRRVQAHERVCRENQVSHHDDLSVAAIIV